MSGGPYARVYHSVMDDDKFDGIREDPRLFGSWVLLLVVADMAYPAPAYCPPPVTRASFQRLVEAGLVDEMSGHRYRIHGLEAERTRRTESARVGGLASGRSRSVERPLNEGSQTPRTESNLAKQSKAEQETSTPEPRDPADIYWSLTGRYPTDKVLKWIDDLTAQYGADPTIKAIADSHIADRSTATLLGRAQDILRAGARQLDLKERTAEQKRIAEQRAKPKAEEPWRVEYRKAIEDHYRRDAA